MRGDFVLGLLVVMVAPAVAGWWPEKPPPEFAGPYEGKLTVNRVPLADMAQHCRNVPRVTGCAYWDSIKLSYCTVWIPSDVSPQMEAAILKHELGHCNGWKHYYPDGPPWQVKPVEQKIDPEDAIRRARSSPACQEKPKPEACP